MNITAKADRNARIVELHVEQGLNLAEIGKLHGLTRERVRQIIKDHGVQTLTRERWAANRAERVSRQQERVSANGAYRRSLDFIRDRSEVDDNGCWIWTMSKYPTGYGHLNWLGKGAGDYAHRVSWQIANGRGIPAGLFICHKCDVPACVNPDHLFLGTPKDNTQDAIRKGRFYQHRSAKPGKQGFQKAAA